MRFSDENEKKGLLYCVTAAPWSLFQDLPYLF